MLSVGDVLVVKVPGKPGAKPRTRTSFFKKTKAGKVLRDKPLTFNPSQAIKWETQVRDYVEMAMVEADWPPGIAAPIDVSWVAVFPRPQARPVKVPKEDWARRGRIYRPSRPDRDNIDKAVMDACTKANVWADDEWVVDGRIITVYASMSEEPGLHLRITILPFAFSYSVK